MASNNTQVASLLNRKEDESNTKTITNTNIKTSRYKIKFNNDNKRLSSKTFKKVKKKKELAASTASLLQMSTITTPNGDNDTKQQLELIEMNKLENEPKELENEDCSDTESQHEPEIFIQGKGTLNDMKKASSSFYEAMTKLELSRKNESESPHRTSSASLSIEDFLKVWDDSWSDDQISTYFSKYLTDPRLIELDKAYKSMYGDDVNEYQYMLVPNDIWRIILEFEVGSTRIHTQEMYHNWISLKREQIYWIPYILGSIEFLGVFFILFYVFVSGTSLHDAADIGAADITDNDEISNNNDYNNYSNNKAFHLNIQLYCAVVTVIASVIQIMGACWVYYFARYRYCHKLKRFKQIIYLNGIDDNDIYNHDAPKLQICTPGTMNDNDDDIDQYHADDDNDDDNDNDNDNDNDAETNDNRDKTDDTKEEGDDENEHKYHYDNVNLPNVEINFDINQVPYRFRHLYLPQRERNRYRNRGRNRNRTRDYIDSGSDTNSDTFPPPMTTNDDIDHNDINGEAEREGGTERTAEEIAKYEQKQKTMRLNYMMGIRKKNKKKKKKKTKTKNKNKTKRLRSSGIARRILAPGETNNESDDDDDDDVDDMQYRADPHTFTTTKEEMQLILSGWEAYIPFQRWINISSLVVTDNLSDPYLICFVLHKYFFVICIGVYVFGCSSLKSLIPFFVLFLSFSYLGLIVLDRMTAKRATCYIISMVSCCGIVIGIFVGILSLLSFVFYSDNGDVVHHRFRHVIILMKNQIELYLPPKCINLKLLCKSLPNAPFPGLATQDCFWCCCDKCSYHVYFGLDAGICAGKCR